MNITSISGGVKDNEESPVWPSSETQLSEPLSTVGM